MFRISDLDFSREKSCDFCGKRSLFVLEYSREETKVFYNVCVGCLKKKEREIGKKIEFRIA
ncbi:hypothetical protein A9K97_gp315 [Tokyovirus A1]|uniref:hypothetical protein n=1 Tax=Tokyovirus A1 TaxID=1826170 RepID=UPI0007A97359|nr:hypothetical protein A9K97_gp315 [Tokyovirus A1]BAU80036.1 hypothetical protein [Tokyovirus A1]